jgi:hypothetical protein
LAGSVHNAARGRVPAIVIAGLSPVTDGAIAWALAKRIHYHYIQDMTRQHELVASIHEVVLRSARARNRESGGWPAPFKIATAPPEGPIYIYRRPRNLGRAGRRKDRVSGVLACGWARRSGDTEIQEIYQAIDRYPNGRL